MYIDEFEDIPFPALMQLTGECNQGGRVTDGMDRRLIMAILRTYYNPEMFDDEYSLSPSGIYKNPLDGDHESFLTFVTDTMPTFQMPEVFGFHENANITKDLNDTNAL